MLLDREIRSAIDEGRITVDPADSIGSRIQPASLDIRLGSDFLIFDRRRCEIVDPKLDQSGAWDAHHVAEDSHLLLYPGEMILATTYERIGLADDVAARVEGKSSLGRLGILVHSTAGFIDPGWSLAPITLEISTVMTVPTRLYPRMPIAQLAFEETSEVAFGYAGKYVRQDGPTASRFHRNWTGTQWM